ncbi:MAG: SUMF1/EgtB/PvdO family nonheme iron enzyme [Rhodospirillales bacterium]|nr:SUMF1/EgtB/PvdO family nonheme iron enzyme [Rhodospirillales bacterium]
MKLPASTKIQGEAMADVFISYARSDCAKAERLARLLTKRGWSVWWDSSLKAGEIWDEVIERQLNTARCVLVLWSRQSVARRWVRAEASEGLSRGILVPAVLEPGRIPLQFRQVQAEDLTGWDGSPTHPGLQRLLQVIAMRIGSANVLEGGRAAIDDPKAAATIAGTAAARRTPWRADDPSLPWAFRDVDVAWCPELVGLPAGGFLMGSPPNDPSCAADERPQHRVELSHRFAIGRFAVTFQEYDHFCEVAGREKPGDFGWGRGRRPVIKVNWADAQAYAGWLSEVTGQTYRLPSEAEWEYACRAGTTSRYACGDELRDDDANVAGRLRCTAEVGSLAANPWGLFDMHGNVWEWVEDHWHGDYEGAPTDGSAWIDPPSVGPDDKRVLRGGSWNNFPRHCRSANRVAYRAIFRYNSFGFRIARTLD